MSAHHRGWRFRVLRWPLPEGRDPAEDVGVVLGLPFRPHLRLVKFPSTPGVCRWVVGVAKEGAFGRGAPPDGWPRGEVLAALGLA